MTPSAKSAAIAGSQALVPERLLDQGEVVILAIKPSAWFVLVYSWPIIAVAGALAAASYIAQASFQLDVRPSVVLLVCAIMVVLQLFVACCQWVGRLYVLTNIRIMRVRGIFRVDLFQVHLKNVAEVVLTTNLPEKALAIGSLYFKVPNSTADEPGWLHISRPAETHEIVRDAVMRSR